jgi:hypothetical protein
MDELTAKFALPIMPVYRSACVDPDRARRMISSGKGILSWVLGEEAELTVALSCARVVRIFIPKSRPNMRGGRAMEGPKGLFIPCIADLR